MKPVRTCVGCRVRAERSSLLRVVAHGSQLVADPSATSPGRGAWLHPTIECFRDAVRRRAFGRALRVTGQLDTSSLTVLMKDSAYEKRALTREQAERLMDKK